MSEAEDFSWRDWIASCVYGSCIIIQMVLTYFRYNSMGLNVLANARAQRASARS